jgi:hypothetical protein
VQVTFQCVNSYFTENGWYYQNPVGGTPNDFDPYAGFVNPGSAFSGFDATFVFTANAGSFIFTNSAIGGSQIWINYPFLTGDQLHINTVAGTRQLSLIRSGVTSSLISYSSMAVSGGSEWVTIAPFFNQFTISGLAVGKVNLSQMSFVPRHWGF